MKLFYANSLEETGVPVFQTHPAFVPGV